MRRVNLLRGAYSSRWMAAATATGKAITAVRPRIQTDPTRAAFTPARSGKREAKLVRNARST